MINGGEKALAIVGLYSVIERDFPRWTQEKQNEFDKFDDEIQELADKCIRGKIALNELKVLSNYDKTLEKIKTPISSADRRAIQYKFPQTADELASEFVVTLDNVWSHLAEIFPVSEYLTFLGPKNLTPTGDKTWEFFNKLLVLNDPRDVYMLISSGAMLKSQAAMVKEFYPTMSADITKSLYAAVAKVRAERGDNYLMPVNVSLGLGNWLERRTVEYDPNPTEPVKPTNSLSKNGPAPQAAVSLSPSERITQAGEAK
jgi:hypothetical protein